ncbi:3'-5' exonuclease [bacterium]|nr:3'-5' exonuclease [bacterium]
MINQSVLEDILFLDVETVSQYEHFEQMPERWKALWTHKARFLAKEDESAEELYDRAGIYAEFGKIVCISTGFLVRSGAGFQLRVKSFYGDDEKLLLQEFIQLLARNFNEPRHLLCAHNGKEFDFPYLCRRMIINGLELPSILDIAGKKPWEIQHLDTMQLWKFGDFKSYTSLELLAAAFDIPTPKDDIDGSMIRDVYYEQKDLDRIKVYCQKDVLTLCNVLLKFNQLPIITEDDLTIVP